MHIHINIHTYTYIYIGGQSVPEGSRNPVVCV